MSHLNSSIEPEVVDQSVGVAMLRGAIGLSLAALLLCGFVYSLAATGLGQLLFPAQANGSLITVQDRVVGSRLVAQPFVSDQYFYARPSASHYDVMTTSGSNLAQSNPELQKQVQQRIAAIMAKEQVLASQIPSDLVTTSGSGIDPEISVAAAMLQVPRIAAQRQISAAELEKVLQQQIKPKFAGVLGQERINVLELNLAIDQHFKVKS
ncbi:K+-transporting ATPase ATPase C chain [Acinetobacter calcoaceticus]|uniref:Potassium-transporting ATPase KdpC subunit n=1 Tax=Acinetobacter calcoaceticus TaxID=471 RepID=A0A4R1XTP8_ACICA|nr:K+-transporting ATPase ATPase C chain [Acinetobacter calcoaceticus]